MQDQQAFEWYFGATAHNLATLSNPLFSDLQNFPDGREPHGQRRGAGPRHPARAADPARRPVGDLPRRRAARPGAHGIRVVLAVPSPPARCTRSPPPSARASSGFAPGTGLARQRPPELRRAVPRAASSSTACCASRRATARCATVSCWACSPRGRCFIGEEVLLLTAIGLAVGGVVLPRARAAPTCAGCCPASASARRSASRSSRCRCGGSSPARRATATIFHPPAGNDLAQLWGRATRSIGADPWASAALSMNRTEENSFFGVPLLLAAAAVVVVLWRRALVQALGAVVVVSCWLSLGEEVVVNGTVDRHPGPVGAARARCPCSRTCCRPASPSSRCPALGALLALGIEEVRRVTTRYAGHAGAGLAVARGRRAARAAARSCPPRSSSTSAPRCRRSSATARGATGSTRAGRCSRRPRRGSPTPGPWSGRREARWGFPVVAGYFVGPDSHDRARRPVRRDADRADPVDVGHRRERAGPGGRPRARSSSSVTTCAAARVDAVVLPDARPEAPVLLASLTSAFGEPDAHRGRLRLGREGA